MSTEKNDKKFKPYARQSKLSFINKLLPTSLQISENNGQQARSSASTSQTEVNQEKLIDIFETPNTSNMKVNTTFTVNNEAEVSTTSNTNPVANTNTNDNSIFVETNTA